MKIFWRVRAWKHKFLCWPWVSKTFLEAERARHQHALDAVEATYEVYRQKDLAVIETVLKHSARFERGGGFMVVRSASKSILMPSFCTTSAHAATANTWSVMVAWCWNKPFENSASYESSYQTGKEAGTMKNLKPGFERRSIAGEWPTIVHQNEFENIDRWWPDNPAPDECYVDSPAPPVSEPWTLKEGPAQITYCPKLEGDGTSWRLAGKMVVIETVRDCWSSVVFEGEMLDVSNRNLIERGSGDVRWLEFKPSDATIFLGRYGDCDLWLDPTCPMVDGDDVAIVAVTKTGYEWFYPDENPAAIEGYRRARLRNLLPQKPKTDPVASARACTPEPVGYTCTCGHWHPVGHHCPLGTPDLMRPCGKPCDVNDLAQGVPYDVVRRLVDATKCAVSNNISLHYDPDSISAVVRAVEKAEAAMKGGQVNPVAPLPSAAVWAMMTRVEKFLDALDGGNMSGQQRDALRREVQAVRTEIGEEP